MGAEDRARKRGKRLPVITNLFEAKHLEKPWRIRDEDWGTTKQPHSPSYTQMLPEGLSLAVWGRKKILESRYLKTGVPQLCTKTGRKVNLGENSH